MRRPLSFVLLLILFSLTSLAFSQPSEPVTIRFGVAPQQSANQLAETWRPFLEYLAKKTGYRFHFQTAKNVQIFENRADKGEFDIVYINPYYYTVVRKTQGYEVIAKEKEQVLKGIVVVHKDSPYKTLNDLNNQAMAFPSASAFAATVLPKAYFNKLKIKIKPVYVASHDSVCRTVAKKLYPAGGTIERFFNALDPEVKSNLRVLWTSESYTSHAIAVHPRLPRNVVDNLKKVMWDMDKDKPEGWRALQKLKFKGIVTADDSEYENIRALGDAFSGAS